MAEIDLIPQEYRDSITRQSMLRRYVLAIAVLNTLIVVASLVVGQFSRSFDEQARQLNTDNLQTQQQLTQLDQLRQQEAEYERQLGLLKGLRAGAAIDEIFAIVDQALDGQDLWFLDWDFRRAGVVVNGEKRAVETGYFVIVDEGQGAGRNKLRIETFMTIHGQAKDHQALSTFVRALFDQHQIKDVSVQKTAATSYANGRVVEFDMTITLNNALQEPS